MEVICKNLRREISRTFTNKKREDAPSTDAFNETLTLLLPMLPIAIFAQY
jgi:hypothetical protein